MLNQFSLFSRWVNRSPQDKLDILSHSTHERANSILATTGHNFYFLPSAERHKWNEKNCPIPSNIKFLENINYNQSQTFDCVISQTLGQLSEDIKVARLLDIPVILVHHCLKSATGKPDKYWKQVGEVCGADYTVFITEHQAADWKPEFWPNPVVIRHGIDIETFSGWTPEKSAGHVLNVTNDFINRGPVMGWDVCQETLNGMKVRLVGDTLKPDGTRFSEAAPNLEALINEYRSCGVYFSCTRLSSISTSLLEAMSCGCPCVIYDTFSVKDYFKDGVHCFISNDTKVLRDRVEWCLANPNEAAIMGHNARMAVAGHFNMNSFTTRWNELLYKAVDNKVNPK